jgi:pentatricopeptide repeat protein
MLPQVAGHIFHHTSRAVAAAQNQAGYTLRNVIGFQTGTNPSSTSSLASWNNNTGSSSWGNGHAGAGGGAKFHPGSRFYSGYKVSHPPSAPFQVRSLISIQQPSRSVAQANTSSTDTGVTYQDDTDESSPTVPQTVAQSTRVARKQRSRSQSFSLGSDAIATAERAKSFGVLRAVQQHARLHHAFVGSYHPQRVPGDVELTSRPPTPRLVRRNSTASTVSVSSLPDDIPLSSRPAPSVDLESVHPQSVLAPKLRPDSPLHPRAATPTSTAPTDSQPLDPFEVRVGLLKLRQHDYESTVDDWNDVLDKLVVLRKHSEQPTEILQTYNDMVIRSIQPNVRTYMILINVLTARDEEVHWHVEDISKRIEKRHTLGLSDHAENFVDRRRLEALRGEQNFPSALRLFAAFSVNRNYFLPVSIYNALLRSCARHQNVQEAIRVFTHLERRGIPKPTATVYAHLLDVYMSVNDVEGARVVFDEFRRVCSQGKISWDEANPKSARAGHIRVWNSMIYAYLGAANPGAALDLLGEMLDTEAGIEFGPKDVPAPAMSTYVAIVRGFCLMDDPSSAVSWFERLIDQGKPTKYEWAPTLEPPQPTSEFWRQFLDQLCELDRVDDINRLYARYATRFDGPSRIPGFMRRIAYFANIRYLQSHEVGVEQAVALLDQALSALGPRENWSSVLTDMNGLEATQELIGMYARLGYADKAVDLIEQLSAFSQDGWAWPVRSPHDVLPDERPNLIHTVSDMVLFDRDILRPLPLLTVLRIVKVWETRGMHVTQRLAQAVLGAYTLAQERQDQFKELTSQDWEALAFSVSTYGESRTEDGDISKVLSLLTDMARFGIDPGHISEVVMHNLLRPVIHQKGIVETTALMENLGPGFSALLDHPKSFAYVQPADLPPPQSTPNAAPVDVGTMRIDGYHGRYIDELNMRCGKDDTAVAAFRRFERGAALGTFPTPEVVGRLIEGLGRAGEMAKVDYLYGVAQNIISLLHGSKNAQLDGWAAIENSMVIARGHAGDGLSADTHRLRLLQQGLTPTADAYGALIQCVKDTTDDTARALEYFHESQARGVQPNIFLYNTAISKLAKARKAEYALELFHKMKSSGIVPSSITYGAVIAACCRVGDSASAEILFEEMIAQRNFRPRVPPYNTMMQFYVQTKPNRDRCLHYYNRMISAGIKPTAHSYKA